MPIFVLACATNACSSILKTVESSWSWVLQVMFTWRLFWKCWQCYLLNLRVCFPWSLCLMYGSTCLVYGSKLLHNADHAFSGDFYLLHTCVPMHMVRLFWPLTFGNVLLPVLYSSGVVHTEFQWVSLRSPWFCHLTHATMHTCLHLFVLLRAMTVRWLCA